MNGRAYRTRRGTAWRLESVARIVKQRSEAVWAGALGPRNLVMGPERLRMMDEQGIDMEALSINPTWYATGRDLAARIIKIQNQKLAELCASQPDRFVAFATVALQHPDLAAQQLEEGIKKLGMRGGSIGASVNGEELSARRFDPFWAKAEELGALLFMHPQGTPELQNSRNVCRGTAC